MVPARLRRLRPVCSPVLTGKKFSGKPRSVRRSASVLEGVERVHRISHKARLSYARLLFRGRTERRPTCRTLDQRAETPAARPARGGIRWPADGSCRLRVAVPAHDNGGHGTVPNDPADLEVLQAGQAGGRVFQATSPGCRRAHRLPRFQLVDRQQGQGGRDPGDLLHAAADVGLGAVANQSRAEVRRFDSVGADV